MKHHRATLDLIITRNVVTWLSMNPINFVANVKGDPQSQRENLPRGANVIRAKY